MGRYTAVTPQAVALRNADSGCIPVRSGRGFSFHRTVRVLSLRLPDNLTIWPGMALGYEDAAAALINSWRSPGEPTDAFCRRSRLFDSWPGNGHFGPFRPRSPARRQRHLPSFHAVVSGFFLPVCCSAP